MLGPALIVAALSLNFAPAPAFRDRPLTPKEQAALLKSVEEEMRAAVKEKDDAGPTPEAEKVFRRRSRVAAQRLDRLHEAMPPGGDLRAQVGLKAASAWSWAGEPKRAVRYYEDVIERAPHLDSRLEGLILASGCYVRLNRSDEAAKTMKRVRQELAMLDTTRRKVWEMELRAVERELRTP